MRNPHALLRWLPSGVQRESWHRAQSVSRQSFDKIQARQSFCHISASSSPIVTARSPFAIHHVSRTRAIPTTCLFLRGATLSAKAQLHTTSQRADAPDSQLSASRQVELVREPEAEEDETKVFAKSAKASQAAQVNLSARLSDSKSSQSPSGFGEVWRLIRIARPETKSLAVAVSLLCISSSISLAIPYSIGKILDVATSTGSNDTIFGLSQGTFYVALGSILVVGAAANYGRIIILRIVGERIVTRLRSSLFRRTLRQDAEFFDANRVGDLISRLGSDTIIVGKSITQNLSDGLRSLISGGAGIGLMAFTSLKLTGILALMFPPVGIGAFFYGRVIRNLSRKIQRNLGTLTKIAEERLGNVRTAQAFAGESLEVTRYNNQTRKIFNLGKREAWISATFFSASGLAGNMTIILLLYVGGGMVRSGAISIGELTSFLMYTAFAGSSLFGLSAFYSELMKGVGAASRLFELQDRETKISSTKGLAVQSARGTIRFDDVSFSYPTRPAVSIFNQLNFEIKPGQNVAIVSPSGGGKSTIAALLLRFYNTTGGTISIGGVDISKMNAKALRRKIGFVAQEPVLFSGTIAENIAYAKPRATRSEIIAAARKANCTFISDFPDGLDTNVGPRGAQLSGGQKQRIAIARALVKNPDILILDEATSALDAESETLVNSALASLIRGNNTTISIAHRLSTIQRSDSILVLSPDGTLAEQGTYRELSRNPDSAFMKLMEWQLQGSDGTEPLRAAVKHRGPPSDAEVSMAQAEQEDDSTHEEEEDHEEDHEVREREKTRSSSSSEGGANPP